MDYDFEQDFCIVNLTHWEGGFVWGLHSRLLKTSLDYPT